MAEDNAQQNSPQFTPEQLSKQAEEIAERKIESLKQDLVHSLSGQAPAAAPSDWSEVARTSDVQKATENAVEAARKEAQRIIDEREKARETKEKQTLESQQKEAARRHEQITNEWRELVSDGVLPPINTEVENKLKSGVDFSALSQDEQNDPGIVAYQRAFQIYDQEARTGKATSFYRTILRSFNQRPAGSSAPVFGNQVPSAQPAPGEEDYTYEEIHRNAKAKGLI